MVPAQLRAGRAYPQGCDPLTEAQIVAVLGVLCELVCEDAAHVRATTTEALDARAVEVRCLMRHVLPEGGFWERSDLRDRVRRLVAAMAAEGGDAADDTTENVQDDEESDAADEESDAADEESDAADEESDVADEESDAAEDTERDSARRCHDDGSDLRLTCACTTCARVSTAVTRWRAWCPSSDDRLSQILHQHVDRAWRDR